MTKSNINDKRDFHYLNLLSSGIWTPGIKKPWYTDPRHEKSPGIWTPGIKKPWYMDPRHKKALGYGPQA